MPASFTQFRSNHTFPLSAHETFDWEFLPQPERGYIPPRNRRDRQVWPGYWIYHNRDDSISFGTEEREYFGWPPAEVTRVVPESLIQAIASMFATPTAWGGRKHTISSSNSFSSRCACRIGRTIR